MDCYICGGVGEMSIYDNYPYTKANMPLKHDACKKIEQDAPDQGEAIWKLEDLDLKNYVDIFELFTIPLVGTETTEDIIQNLNAKVVEKLYESNDSFRINTDKFAEITSKEARREIMSMFFYDQYKYTCLEDRTTREVNKEYLKKIKILYAAIFGKCSLQTYCLDVLRNSQVNKLQNAESIQDQPVNDSACSGQNETSTEYNDTSGETETIPGTSNCEMKNMLVADGKTTQDLPKSLRESVEGLKYFHGRDLCFDTESDYLSSDDLFLIINKPYKVAIGMYGYHFRYYG